uniref:L1 transposable element RRM domain-containing protein n=1 Tax=Astyanax mexicanus TaxID=7994 RepID=A0A3B1KGD5_ASTMX
RKKKKKGRELREIWAGVLNCVLGGACSYIPPFYLIRSGRVEKGVVGEEVGCELSSREKKLADLEDRSRRNNVRLVGLPEGTEGSDPTGFNQKAIKEWFPTLANSEMEVERAHRVYRSQKDTRNSPRVFIFKLLRYQDRQRLLKASRASGPISHSGANLRFFVDYSSFTSKRRMAFLPVQKSLRAEGIESFLLYPAQLKVTISGTVHTFSSPQEAEGRLPSLFRNDEKKEVLKQFLPKARTEKTNGQLILQKWCH